MHHMAGGGGEVVPDDAFWFSPKSGVDPDFRSR